MNILMLGWSRQPGSWDIRGKQLAPHMGARAVSNPTSEDWRWADVACIVKRSEPRYGPTARSIGLPIVWDALDFWGQPAENDLSEAAALARVRAHAAAIQPRQIIGATQRMADDAGGVYLPHHSWPGLEPGDVRPEMCSVAYQGNPAYLGQWMPRLVDICLKHGWTFDLNPTDLRTADVLVALRGGPWDGWMCRQWKSGVKLVNAIAAGRPIVMQDSAAAIEIGPPGSIVDTGEALEAALLSWRDPARRMAAAVECAAEAPRYQVSAIATRYTAVLNEVVVHA